MFQQTHINKASKAPLPLVFKNSQNVPFRRINPGQFHLYVGASVRTITITQSFYIGFYEVTNYEYQQYIKENGIKDLKHEKYEEGRLPVVFINWIDAQKYIKWLNIKNDLKSLGNNWRYSLPTEAQWELACRGGTSSDYFWGNSPEGGKG